MGERARERKNWRESELAKEREGGEFGGEEADSLELELTQE